MRLESLNVEIPYLIPRHFVPIMIICEIYLTYLSIELSENLLYVELLLTF